MAATEGPSGAGQRSAERLFISYARADAATVRELVVELRELGYDPFFDSDLTGGQRWWDTLLDRIENSDVFIPVISPDYVASEACYRETTWADALRLAFLPLDVGGVDPSSCPRAIADANWVRYDLEARTSLARLSHALRRITPGTRPAVLPRRPEIPMTYFGELEREIAGNLTWERQIVVIATLKGRLGTREDATARRLLHELQQNESVSHTNWREIADLLAPPDDAPSAPVAPAAEPTHTPEPAPDQFPAPAAPENPTPTPPPVEPATEPEPEPERRPEPEPAPAPEPEPTAVLGGLSPEAKSRRIAIGALVALALAIGAAIIFAVVNAGMSDDEKALVSRLPKGIAEASTCEGDKTEAAVSVECVPRDASDVTSVYARNYDSGDTRDDVTAWETLPSGQCKEGRSNRSTFRDPTTQEQQVVYFVNDADDDMTIWWQAASGTDPDYFALYGTSDICGWWSDWADG